MGGLAMQQDQNKVKWKRPEGLKKWGSSLRVGALSGRVWDLWKGCKGRIYQGQDLKGKAGSKIYLSQLDMRVRIFLAHLQCQVYLRDAWYAHTYGQLTDGGLFKVTLSALHTCSQLFSCTPHPYPINLIAVMQGSNRYPLQVQLVHLLHVVAQHLDNFDLSSSHSTLLSGSPH